MPQDYMSMAQGAAPTSDKPEVKEEDLQLTEEGYEEMGLPSGQNPEDIRERILITLEEAGIMEGLDQAELQEIIQLVDQLVADIEAENFEAVEQNPVMQLLGAVFEEMGVGGEAEQPMDPAAMAAPMPGGM